MSFTDLITTWETALFNMAGAAGGLLGSGLLSGRAIQIREQEKEREKFRLRYRMLTGIVPTRMMYDDIPGTEMFRCQFTHQNVPVIRIDDTSVSTW